MLFDNTKKSHWELERSEFYVAQKSMVRYFVHDPYFLDCLTLHRRFLDCIRIRDRFLPITFPLLQTTFHKVIQHVRWQQPLIGNGVVSLLHKLLLSDVDHGQRCESPVSISIPRHAFLIGIEPLIGAELMQQTELHAPQRLRQSESQIGNSSLSISWRDLIKCDSSISARLVAAVMELAAKSIFRSKES